MPIRNYINLPPPTSLPHRGPADKSAEAWQKFLEDESVREQEIKKRTLVYSVRMIFVIVLVFLFFGGIVARHYQEKVSDERNEYIKSGDW